jgi:hypothetical protein
MAEAIFETIQRSIYPVVRDDFSTTETLVGYHQDPELGWDKKVRNSTLSLAMERTIWWDENYHLEGFVYHVMSHSKYSSNNHAGWLPSLRKFPCQEDFVRLASATPGLILDKSMTDDLGVEHFEDPEYFLKVSYDMVGYSEKRSVFISINQWGPADLKTTATLILPRVAEISNKLNPKRKIPDQIVEQLVMIAMETDQKVQPINVLDRQNHS